MVVGIALVCDRCTYTKYPSPEYSVCEPADEFLEAAVQLGGTPPFPASFSAYWACELYLRELGGYYYYTEDGDGDGEFRPATTHHGLSGLRSRLPEPRRDRLDAEQRDGSSFLELFKQLPNGLFPFLRYRGESLSYPEKNQPQPHIAPDGRLHIGEADVYEILVQMGRILQKFVKDEFRRNLHNT